MTFSESPRASDLFLDSSSPAPPKLDFSGAQSHFYRSPQTPSAASSLCRSITPSQGSRKRARRGYDDLDNRKDSLNSGGLGGRVGGWEDQASASFSGLGSPAPLADTQYRLAGGADLSRGTAGHTALGRYDGLNDNGGGPELDYRPSRYTISSTEVTSRKRGRRPSTSTSDTVSASKSSDDSHSENNWGRVVLSFVGDVAGKVWDFCWSGSFRGFYAGGGQGYEINPGASTSSSNPALQPSGNHQCSCKKDETGVSGVSAPCQHSGQVHRDELRNNWVLVKSDDGNSIQQSAQKSPRRNVAAHHVASPRRTPARPVASNKRVNLGTPTRPSPYRHQHSPSRGSVKPESPLSVETQRHTAKLRKQEREEDASIRRLNDQLKSMIKEGKEALGTRVEVDEMEFGDSD